MTSEDWLALTQGLGVIGLFIMLAIVGFRGIKDPKYYAQWPRVMDRRCPKCNALVGRRCLTKGGANATKPHKARKELLRQENNSGDICAH
tara:strand:+ start:167 stop:436 length:270 start_codon:yes stop_codon:yes gene_type:complete